MKKVLITILILLIISANPLITLASNCLYEKEAEQFYKFGLYKGRTNNIFNPELELLADRESGIIMLLRLLNEEQNAMDLDDLEVDKLLNNFVDSSEISVWARKQVAYAVKAGIVRGFPDMTLKPKESLTSKMYCTMMLKALGYDFEFNESVVLLCDISNIVGKKSSFMKEGPINRDLLVGISYYTLSAPFKQDGKTIKQKLLDAGVLKFIIKYD